MIHEQTAGAASLHGPMASSKKNEDALYRAARFAAALHELLTFISLECSRVDIQPSTIHRLLAATTNQ